MYVNLNGKDNWKSVRQSNKALMNKFLTFLRSKGRKDRTLKEYENALKIFFIWNMNYNDNKDFINLAKDDFLRFRMYGYNEVKWSASREYVFESIFASLSKYIENELHIEGFKSVLSGIKLKSIVYGVKVSKMPYTTEQINSALDLCVFDGEYKAACLIALIVCSGKDMHDLLKCEVSFFDERHIYKDVLYKLPMAKSYVLKEKFDPYLKLWLDYRKENGIESKWLFPDFNVSEKPWSYDRAKYVISSYIDSTFYVKSLRECAVIEFANAGLPRELLLEMSGLDDDSLARTYVGI